MVKRTNSGTYKCQECGEHYEYKDKAEIHEDLCGQNTLESHIPGVRNVRNFNFSTDLKPDKSRQSTLNETFKF